MEADGDGPGPGPYRAFISYNHVDKGTAEWLHRALERYRVPVELAAALGPSPSGRPGFYPIFRDREELSSGPSLGDQIKEALDRSAWLIVLCSPDAAYSRWVNEEILHFKRIGRQDHILAVILSGEPHATDTGRLHKECFPAALRYRLGPDGALSDERVEPLAADLRPGGDGRALALRKVAAGLLGVGVDALTQRQKLQQRRRRTLQLASASVAAAALVVAGFGLLRWSHSVTYYRAMTERFGLPVGVGPLGEGEAKHRDRRFAFHWRWGRLDQVRVEGGAGALRPLGRDDPFWREDLPGTTSQIRVAAVDRDGRPVSLEFYDDANTLQQVRNFVFTDRTRAVLNFTNPRTGASQINLGGHPATFSEVADEGPGAPRISKYQLDFAPDGRLLAERYLDSDNVPAVAYDNVAGEAFTHDEAGRLVRRSFVDAQDRPVLSRHGFAAVAYDNDGTGEVGAVTTLDAAARPVADPATGVARTVETRDRGGNLTGEAYLDAAGRPAPLPGHGCLARSFDHDSAGNLSVERCLGPAGRPMADARTGVAVTTYRHDARGHRTEAAYFGPEGRPVADRDGIAREVRSYTPDGIVSEITYLGLSGAPTLNHRGISRTRFQVDARGFVVGVESFGVDGRPKADTDGVARRTMGVNDHGLWLEQRFFGADGRPVLNSNGEARWVGTYDSREYLVSLSYYGTDDRPILDRKGIARQTAVYDAQGNRIQTDYFGTDGKPILNRQGIARRRVRFDARGNRIEVENFGTDGRPIADRDGVVRWTADYDDQGRRVRWNRYGPGGRRLPGDRN